MKVILLQKDGIGNQMFQYAAALYFARRLGAALEVIPILEPFAHSHGYPRPFLLSNFCISAQVRRSSRLDRLIASSAPRLRRLAGTARWASQSAVYRQDGAHTWTFLPDLPVAHSARRIYLTGNFQAHQYAEAVEPELRSEFRFRHPASGRNLEVLEQIRAAGNPVSLHMRAGDYKIDSRGEMLLSPRYHARAIEAVTARVHNPTFFIFSDDFPFVRQHLRLMNNMVLVDHNGDSEAHEDLRLIAACRHHIVSNSTFSWWGAWLNPDPAKLVFAPAQWQNRLREISGNDIVPGNWLRIPNDDAIA